jgi:hypothetical protein
MRSPQAPHVPRGGARFGPQPVHLTAGSDDNELKTWNTCAVPTGCLPYSLGDGRDPATRVCSNVILRGCGSDLPAVGWRRHRIGGLR